MSDTLTIQGIIRELGKALIAPSDLWAKYTPIRKKEDGYVVYLYNDIIDPVVYTEIIDLLAYAEVGTEIDLRMCSRGGDYDSSLLLHNAIKESNAIVHGFLDQEAHSGMSIIAMACDTLTVSRYGAMMIHESFGSIGHGKNSDLKNRQAFMDKHLADTYKTIYKNFLTEEELTKVLDGEELWLTGQEARVRFNRANGISQQGDLYGTN